MLVAAPPRVFRFKCTCPCCLQTGEALLRSNRVRQRLSELRSALPSAVPQGLGVQVLGKIVELIDVELRGNAAAKAYAFHMGYQLLKAEEEGHEMAMMYAAQALEEITVAEGKDSWVGRLLRQELAQRASCVACQLAVRDRGKQRCMAGANFSQ